MCIGVHIHTHMDENVTLDVMRDILRGVFQGRALLVIEVPRAASCQPIFVKASAAYSP
jgi:hypothetical protein